jgi:hypothetical protein
MLDMAGRPIQSRTAPNCPQRQLSPRPGEATQDGHESRLAVGVGLFEHVLQVIARGADADRQGLCGALQVVGACQQVRDRGLARRQAEGISQSLAVDR